MIKKLIPIIALLLLVVYLSGVFALGETIFVDDYEVAYSYASAEEGDKFTLTVSITNTGELKEDVVFEIKDDDPFDVSGDEEWDIGDLNPDETTSETFRIEIDSGTPEGEYDLEFTLEDSDDDFEDEMEIEVSSDKPDLIIGDVSSVPLVLAPDQDDVQLSVSVENIGGGDANFVRARLVLLEGFESSSSFSDSVNLGTVAEGSQKIAVFFVDIGDVESGVHVAELVLTYEDGVEEETRILEVELPVKGKPQFEVVSSKTNPGGVPAGSSGLLSLTVRNVGEEKGEETSVRVFEEADFPIEFDEKTKFIGTLDSGKAGSVTFDFDVDEEGVPNNYLVRVQVRTLQDDNILVEEFTVPVKLVEAEQSDFVAYLPIIIILVLAVVVIYIIYRVLTPKKKK